MDHGILLKAFILRHLSITIAIRRNIHLQMSEMDVVKQEQQQGR